MNECGRYLTGYGDNINGYNRDLLYYLGSDPDLVLYPENTEEKMSYIVAFVIGFISGSAALMIASCVYVSREKK